MMNAEAGYASDEIQFHAHRLDSAKQAAIATDLNGTILHEKENARLLDMRR